MNNHTETPWIVAFTGEKMRSYGQPLGIAQKGQPNLIAGVFGDVSGGIDVATSNAAHIVKCVNLHDELVAFAEKAKVYLNHPASHPASVWFDLNEQVRAVLAKVECR